MQLTLNIIRCVFFGWTLLLALHIPGAKRDKRLHILDEHGHGPGGYRKAEKVWKLKGKEGSPGGNELDVGGALDYDLIEVFRTDAGISSEDDFGFTALPGRQCPVECIRGLSGLCICPPVVPYDSISKTSDNLTASHPPTPPSVSGRHNNPLVPLHSTDIIRQNGHFTRHMPYKRRRYKRDDEDEHHIIRIVVGILPSKCEFSNHDNKLLYTKAKNTTETLIVVNCENEICYQEDQKLCKCRRCTKLFKRTLYCRVFPCYQKKCKSGEWREPHH